MTHKRFKNSTEISRVHFTQLLPMTISHITMEYCQSQEIDLDTILTQAQTLFRFYQFYMHFVMCVCVCNAHMCSSMKFYHTKPPSFGVVCYS